MVTKKLLQYVLVILVIIGICFFLKGEDILRTEDIISLIEEQGDSIALVLFSGKCDKPILITAGQQRPRVSFK